MSWSPDPDGLRLVFIAGNESADQAVDRVDFRAVAETARRIQLRLGIPIPTRLLLRLEAGGGRAGWAIFAETVQALRASGLVHGLAVMTPEMDPPPGFAERIVFRITENCII